MSAIVMDGTAVAQKLLRSVAADAGAFERTHGRKACLATVLVGDDPASHTYVRMKANRCRAAGLDSRRHDLPAQTGTADVVRLVRELSADPEVDGILVQHPMPSHIDERAVFDAIAPTQGRGRGDHRVVRGDVVRRARASPRAPPRGSCGCSTPTRFRSRAGRRSSSAGARSSASRSACCCSPATPPSRSATPGRADLAEAVRRADIVVAAVGRPELIRGDWIKPGAVVIDAGYNAGQRRRRRVRRSRRTGRPDHAGAGRGRPDDDRGPARPDRPGRAGCTRNQRVFDLDKSTLPVPSRSFAERPATRPGVSLRPQAVDNAAPVFTGPGRSPGVSSTRCPHDLNKPYGVAHRAVHRLVHRCVCRRLAGGLASGPARVDRRGPAVQGQRRAEGAERFRWAWDPVRPTRASSPELSVPSGLVGRVPAVRPRPQPSVANARGTTGRTPDRRDCR